MSDLDKLSLEIGANATSAIRAIDNLQTSLVGLSDALSSLSNTQGLTNLSASLREFSSSVGEMKKNGVDGRTFEALRVSLNKLGATDSARIQGLGLALSQLNRGFQSLNTSGIDSNVTNVINALTRLSNAPIGVLQGTNFTQLGQGIANLTNSLASGADVSRSTISLVNALSKLAGAGDKVAITASNLPQLSRQLRRFFAVMVNAPSVSAETIQLVSAISQLASVGNKASASAQNLGVLATELKNLITVLSTSPQVTQNTLQLVQALSQISNQGVKINASAREMTGGFNRLVPSLNRTKQATRSLAYTFGKFYASCFLIIRAIKGVWKSVKSAMDTIEIFNYFDATISQISMRAMKNWEEAGYESAEAYFDALYEEFSAQAKELTKKMSGYTVDASGNLTNLGQASLGLNPQLMLNYQAQFAQLASSMGVSSEYAMKISQAMTEIGADLASVKNMDFSKVWDNMSSGLVGMSRAVDKYGTNIRNTALQEKLYDLGIDATVQSLGQQEKALLRAIIILDNTRYAWGDLADTLDQPANQLRMLKANFESLSRTLGTALLSAVAGILPYINALTIAIRRLIDYIIQFFGISLVQISASTGDGMGDLLDQIYDADDALEDASGSAKKLKQNLLGIDELNVISDDKDSGSGAGSGVDITDDLNKAFDQILNEYQQVWDNAYANIEAKAEQMAEKLISYFREGKFYDLGDVIADNLTNALKKINWKEIYETVKDFSSGLAQFLNGLINPEEFYIIGETLAGILNTVIYSKLSFFTTFDWGNLGLSIAEGINGFFENFDFKALADALDSFVYGVGVAIGTALKNLNYKEIFSGIYDFFSNLNIGTLAVGISLISFKLLTGTSVLGALTNWIGSAIATGLTLDIPLLGLNISEIALLTVGAVSVASGVQGLIWDAFGNVTGETEKADALKESYAGLAGAIKMVADEMKILRLTAEGWTVASHWDNGIMQYYIDISDIMERINNGEIISSHEMEQYINAVIELGGSYEEALENVEMFKQGMINNNDVINTLVMTFGTLQDASIETLADIAEGLEGLQGSVGQNGIPMLTISDDMTEDAIEFLNIMQTAINTSGMMGESFGSASDALEWFNSQIVDLGDITGNASGNVIQMVTELDGSVSYVNSATASLEDYNDVVYATSVTWSHTLEEWQTVASYLAQFNDGTNATGETLLALGEQIQVTTDGITDLRDGTYLSLSELEDFGITAGTLASVMENSTDSTDRSVESMKVLKEQSAKNAMAIKSYNSNIQDSSKYTESNNNAIKQSSLIYSDASTQMLGMGRSLGLLETASVNASTSIQIGLNSVKEFFQKEFAPIFKEQNISNMLSDVPSVFEETFKNTANVVVGIFNTMVDNINKAMRIEWNDVEIDGNKVMTKGSAQLFTLSHIPQFALGGFPEDGLFFANHNEMVGKFSNNRNAVANNEQIVAGISNGVEQAVNRAMIPYLSNIADNTRRSADKNFTVNIGDRDIARANIRGQRSMGRTLISTV